MKKDVPVVAATTQTGGKWLVIHTLVVKIEDGTPKIEVRVYGTASYDHRDQIRSGITSILCEEDQTAMFLPKMEGVDQAAWVTPRVNSVRIY